VECNRSRELKTSYTCAAVKPSYITRNWVVLLLLAGTTWPARAAKEVSVEELGRILFAEQGKSDQKVADRLSEVVLTERLTAVRLARWEKEFPGSHTREALIKLSDEVAFLDPPAIDVLRDPPPDNETQEKMLALAMDYVRTTIGRLPNFSATRETTHFEGEPEQQSVFSFARNLGQVVNQSRDLEQTGGTKWLHSEGSTRVTVTYRNGQEVTDTQAAKGAKEGQTINGLTTTGEFGPILSVVMGDAMQGQVTWARWEQGANDPVAVFRYGLPQEQSHYSVEIPDGTKIDDVRPAYHGEIAIDPATGAILRVSVVADLAPPNQMMRAAILVEYAPVEIGDRTYNCPVHGVAFSKIPLALAAGTADRQAVEVQTRLNDVVFANYHLFGSEAHIVMGGSGNAAPDGTGANPTPKPEDAAPGAAPGAGPDSKKE
jgi:hypothetical protein